MFLGCSAGSCALPNFFKYPDIGDLDERILRKVHISERNQE